jgi:arylformamidase
METPIDPALETEYNCRAKVPGHPAIIERWTRDAAAFRAAHPEAELGVAYGPSPRQALDIFPSASPGPMSLFIHGGYWQGLGRSSASHLAAGLLAHGVGVAMVGYDLCPQVTLGEIVEQVRVAARLLRARGRLDLVMGHSAGGHLAAMLLADGLAPAALAISGLFDLRPLVATTMNRALGLDAAEAWRLSPLARPRPAGRIFAVVGGEEGRAFAWQSRAIAEAWGGGWESLPGHDHFSIPAELADPGSVTVARALALMAP